MNRSHNSDRSGNKWSEETIIAVWNKGRKIPYFSSDIWRWDTCGKVMKFIEHGNRDSEYGWEIDHIRPVKFGGSDDPDNLQPLNWINNADKSDKLIWSCPK